MRPRFRRPVGDLIRFRDNFESCDEGEDRKHCRVEFSHVPLREAADQQNAPAIHWSWRHMPFGIDNLSEEEARALVDAGFDCKHGEDGEYVQYIEKKTRHRWLAYRSGWVVSTGADGGNFDRLVGFDDSPIPTIEVTKEVALYGSLVQHWFMLRQDLPIAFLPQHRRCEELLRMLYAEALLVIRSGKTSKEVRVPMGTVVAS